MRLKVYKKIVVLPFASVVCCLLTACYPLPKAAGQFTKAEFDAMTAKMASGTAPDISISQFKSFKSPIVLDSRELVEYQTSHIPQAKWIGYDDFQLSRLKGVSKDEVIVVYCSVGYRSERISEKLIKAGYTKTYNLRGSIFQWVNEGNTIIDKNGKPTTQIHGYNKKWSKWLNKGNVVY